MRPSPCCCLLLTLLAPAQLLLTPPFSHLPPSRTLRSHPQLCAPASASGARRRRGVKKPGRQPSFATRLQQAKTAEDGLELLASAPDTPGTVAALQRLALLFPRSGVEAEATWALCHDARLAAAVAALAGASLGAVPRCAALWSLGMCWDPAVPHGAASRLHVAAAALAAPLEVSLALGFGSGGGWKPASPKARPSPRPSPSPDLGPASVPSPPRSPPSPGGRCRRSGAGGRTACGLGGGVGMRRPRPGYAAVVGSGRARRALPAACAGRRRRARRGRGRPRSERG